MPLIKDRLPEPLGYYSGMGLNIQGKRGKWRRANCPFCQSRDNFNLDTSTGGFHCWSCPAKGGDVLAFHRAFAGLGFIEAAKDLGAWEEDPNRPQHANHRPAPFTPRQALQVLASDLAYCAVCLGNTAQGVELTDAERLQFMESVGRILTIKELTE